jgi:prenylcysteine oxidase / farnesylcysteine lyase
MNCQLVLLLLLLAAICVVADDNAQTMHSLINERKRVAIVGAGIAGTGVAGYLAKLGGDFEVHLFERSATRICGRMYHEDVDYDVLKCPDSRSGASERRRVTLELGATIYHEVNALLGQWVSELQLTPTEHGKDDNVDVDSPNDELGIWNGREFVFETSGKSSALGRWLGSTVATAIDAGRMIWRYGFSSLLSARNLIDETVARYLSGYEALRNGAAYASVARLLDAMHRDMGARTEQTLRQYMLDGGVGGRYIDEFADAVIRVQYGQSSSVNALVGQVALLPVLDNRCHRVIGGNRQLCERLVDYADAMLHLGAVVTDVSESNADADADGCRRRTVRWRDSASGAVSEDAFDVVIIAAPLELAGITLPDDAAALAARTNVERRFQVTHVTMVAGQLEPAYFGRASLDELPHCIFTTETDDVEFTSLCTNVMLNAPHWRLFKIFSRAESDDALLDRLFARRTFVRRWAWHAYPVMKPTPASQMTPFELADNLYYASAFESAISCMETELYGALNVANLIMSNQ